jgi:hypothetical protein
MSRTESYADKTFIVADADARLRKPNNLMEFERFTAADPLPAGEQVGNFKRIAKGTTVKVDKVKVVPTGSSGSIVFGHCLSPDGTTELGWTSTRNFDGKFINETLGAIPPAPKASKFGPNAAWKKGVFDRQLTLVSIVDARLEIERLALDTLDAYLDLVAAAAKDNILVAINSGFRSFPEQKFLFEGFKKSPSWLQPGGKARDFESSERHRLRYRGRGRRRQPDLRLAEEARARAGLHPHRQQGALALGIRPGQGRRRCEEAHLQNEQCHHLAAAFSASAICRADATALRLVLRLSHEDPIAPPCCWRGLHGPSLLFVLESSEGLAKTTQPVVPAFHRKSPARAPE